MTSDIYARMVTALAHLRDLESQGCHPIAAHVHADRAVIQIDPPPASVLDTWSWAYVPPPAGMPTAPVTCRTPRDDGVVVEWHAGTRRPSLRLADTPAGLAVRAA